MAVGRFVISFDTKSSITPQSNSIDYNVVVFIEAIDYNVVFIGYRYIDITNL